MSVRPTYRRGAAALVVMVTMLATGCGTGVVEPTTYATVDSAADFDTTGTEVAEAFHEAAELANEALGGEGVRGGAAASDTLCNEAYPRRFSRLEGGVSLKAPSMPLPEAMKKVQEAWAQQGWKIEVLEPDRVFASTETSTGVPFGVTATLQVFDQGLGASLSVSTRCLKLPESVAEDL
jgi:hypothetical protein